MKLSGYFCLLAMLVGATKIGATNTTPTIAIDVGHSNQRPGATSARGRPEFQFNAALAQTIDDHLHGLGITTLQIGNDGKMLSLPLRTTAAKSTNAAFFLSIHHDSVQPHYLKQWLWQGGKQQYADEFSGFSLFVSQKNPQFSTSLQCASAIGTALKNKGMHPSSHHAEKISGEGKIWADQNNGVYFYDNLIVLKTATMPAVLMEAGIIVNREEEERIQQPAVQKTIAEAIAVGLTQCGVTKTVTKLTWSP